MLDSAGNTDCKVYVGTNGLTGLSNLKVFGLPAGIYNCTGAAYGTADCFCKASELFVGYECSVEGDTLTVRSDSHTLSIPANRSWVMVDSLKKEIPSVTVLAEGEFYVNRSLKQLL